METRLPRLLFFGALLATVVVYLPGLKGPLVLDDVANLEPLIRWMHGRIGWQMVVFDNASGLFGRPVSMASFLANVAISGDSVQGLKIGNLALHLANGVAVYSLFSGLAQKRLLFSGKGGGAVLWFPCIAASVWLLHPLFVSTVLYVVQRMAMLSAFFTILTMVAYLHGRNALEEGDHKKGLLLLGLAAPAFTMLAVLSKENGVLAPALCGLIEWLAFASTPRKDRPLASKLYITLVLIAPALIALYLTIEGHPRVVGDYANRSFTLLERLLTQPRVMWHYVGALLVPYGPRLGLYHDDFPISHGLLAPTGTLLAFVGWAIVIVAGWRVRHRLPSFTLGVGIFMVGQALESSVFPLLIYFEHRVYLPSIGIIMAILGLVLQVNERLTQYMHHGTAVIRSAVIGLIAVLSFATYARASIWSSQDSIFAQALNTHPDSRWLRLDLAGRSMAESPPDVSTALQHADHLMAMPGSLDRRFGALLRLSIECIAGDAISEARIKQVFSGTPVSIEPDLLVAYEGLAERIISQPCRDFSPARMATALTEMLDRSRLNAADRSIWRLRFKAAKLYWAAGNLDAALRQAELAYAPGNSDAAVGVMIAGLLIESGDFQGAEAMLEVVEPHIAASDVAGKDIVARYREKITTHQ